MRKSLCARDTKRETVELLDLFGAFGCFENRLAVLVHAMLYVMYQVGSVILIIVISMTKFLPVQSGYSSDQPVHTSVG